MGSLRETRQVSPEALALARLIVQDSIMGSMYFSENHWFLHLSRHLRH